MKLSATQENLKRALNIVSRVATTRSALPVLANILLKTEKNRLLLVATNLEIAISHSIGAKVEKDGQITVPARLFTEYISSLPPGNINLELENNKLHVKTGDYSSTINGIPAEEYPELPKISSGDRFKLEPEKFKKALQQTIFAASNEETRPILTGLYLHTYEKDLYVVATDSYRLAQKRLGKHGSDLGLVVPANALSELMRILGEGEKDDEIKVSYDDAQVRFIYDDTEIITRQIDGEYPEYRQLIPDKADVEFNIDKNEFINITKVAALFARESAGSITLETSEKDQQVKVTSIASQVGENTSVAPAKVKGEGKVALNSRYLLDALNAIDGEDINFKFSGKISPCVLSSEEDKDYIHIIMPLKS